MRACATPWAIPPWRCPSTITGLMMRPASSQVTIRSSRTWPVSTSTSTTARWVPNGYEQSRFSWDSASSAPLSAAAATSAQLLVTDGEPTTWKPPASESSTTSETSASRRSAATLRASSTTTPAASWMAEPPSWVDLEPKVP